MECTEIRHASLNELQAIARVLEEAQAWKKFMAHIPVDLNSPNSRPKYNSDHISLIETESTKQKRFCAEILFEEWGTSGKIRPTLGNLLKILMNAELFRAADMVAVNLLNQPPVERPSTGVAAKVDISLTNLIHDKSVDNQNTEKLLDDMSYPDTIQNMQTFDKNLDYVIKQENSNYPDKMLNIVKNLSSNSNESKGLNSQMTNSTILELESDMMKFTKSQNDLIVQTEIIPQISMLLNNNQNTVSDIPSVNKTTSDLPNTETETTNSEILSNIISDAEFPIEINNSLDSAENLNSFIMPHLSMLQNNSSILSSEDCIIPNLSALQGSSTSQSSKSVTLNTRLPHFSYVELEKATQKFSLNIFSESSPNVNDMNDSAYLASGLYDQIVIVKKLKPLHLSGDQFDNLIFKQFKTEVEIMSQYNHENVLSLLGYSWDGPNYCLVYEYFDGGTLKQNLTNSHELTPQIRKSIAFGIAKGIEYLHCRSVIHGDVKSSNILLTKEKIPKLCDFGLVRQLSNQSSTPNAIKSTIYLAPEAFESNVSAKIDVYSFGVIILELLTGSPATDEKQYNKKNIVEHAQNSSFDEFFSIIDPIMKDWLLSEKLYKLAKCFLAQENQRPSIADAVKMLSIIV